MAVSKSCCVVLCVVLLAQMVFSAPGYSDYENVRDLYELLLQKEALDNRGVQPVGTHELVRKSNRVPSLRLRFGRRADPLLANALSPAETAAEN